jgi:hypothetical protein
VWILFVIAIIHGNVVVDNKPFDSQVACEAAKAVVMKGVTEMDPGNAKLSMTCFEPKPIGRVA